MARAATPRKPAQSKRPAQRAGAAANKPAAARKATRAAKAVKPSSTPGPSKLARAAGKKAFKWAAHKVLESSAETIRAAAERAAEAGRGALETGVGKAASNRLPIQVSVDVAVPLTVAWDEWMTFESLTEGVHRIEEVERDGDCLIGTISGPRSSEWVADIVDERPEESFAWRSVEGSDCAGLATFHRLSERLTRIELDLDVLPRNPAQALSLSLHLAHRHAEAELRRFKARVEFIDPDAYETEGSRNGGAPDTGPETETETDQ